MKSKELNWDKLDEIIKERKDDRWALIPVLQGIQEVFGYIPPEFVEPVALALNVFPSEVQGVITFYSGFTLEPKGKNVIKTCRGTACHVKGSKSILRFIKKELALDEGETSPDYQFTLETVACLGACFLAPAMMVNRTYFGKLSPQKVRSILMQFEKQKTEDEGSKK